MSKWLLVQSFPVAGILNTSGAWLWWKFQRSLPRAAVLTWADAQGLRKCSREHVAQHTAGAWLCPPSLQAQRTWAWQESFRVGFQFLSVPTRKTELKKSLISALICCSYLLQVKFQHLTDLKGLAGMWELPWWSICNKTAFPTWAAHPNPDLIN